LIDLRVEDSAEPLIELRRLIRIRAAYAADAEADRLDEAGETAAAGEKRREAFELAPEIVELRFWAGLAKATAGDVDGGTALIGEAVRQDGRWVETLRRLATVERVPAQLAASIEARLASRPTAK
jgi:uncharacterized Ntn-hydrolase superfamily protein